MFNKSLNTILFASLVLMSGFVSSCASKRKPVQTEVIGSEQNQTSEQNMPANVVYFDFNEYNISNDGEKVIATFTENTNADSIIVEGHCDVRGTDEYNMSLGEKRASAVKKYIEKHNHACSKNGTKLEIQTVSKGKQQLASMGDAEEDHAKNRRAVLIPNSGK